MPYKIFQENGKYCVYKHDQAGNKVGSSHGCHPSRKNAIEQMRALYAAEPGLKEVGMMDCPECGATVSKGTKKCPECGADLTSMGEKARSDLQPGDFLVPAERSLPITKTPGGAPDHGLCGAAWAALHEGFRGNKYEGPNKGKALTKLTAIYNRMKWPLPTAAAKELRGVKGLEHDGDRYLILWTSNAFQDREGEIFKTKALEDYVARHDATGDYGRVWFWHVKGTDFADVVWEDVVGRMLVSVARMDKTAYADKMWHAINFPEEYKDILPLGWGTSHGYAYRSTDKQDGVYDFMEKFESTVLPYHRASNLWGGVKETIEMARTKEKDDVLKKLVGEEIAAQTLSDAEKATSVLEQANISFKEVGEKADNENTEAEEVAEGEDDEFYDTTADEDEEAGDETDTDEEQLYELEVTDELVKEIAGKVDVKSAVKEHVDTALTGLKEQIVAVLTPVIVQAVNAAMTTQLQGQKEQIVQQALSGKIKLTPWSASHSDDTVVPEGQVAGAKEAKTGKHQQDVVAEVVRGMMSGKL